MPHVTRTAVASRSCSPHPAMNRSQSILYVKDTRLAVSDLASKELTALGRDRYYSYLQQRERNPSISRLCARAAMERYTFRYHDTKGRH